MKKLQLFDQSMFILSKKACFLTRTSPNTCSGCILHKTKCSQNFKFQKCQFCGFLKPMFFLFRNACLLYKTSKIVFSRSIFTIYDMGIPGGYKGLQGVTRGYKRLQGVTGCDTGLQGVTKGDRG